MDHYDPDLVKKKLDEVASWLSSESPPPNDEERAKRGWDTAYSLTVWEEFPGSDIMSTRVLLQTLMGGRVNLAKTGPTKKSSDHAKGLRSTIQRMSMS